MNNESESNALGYVEIEESGKKRNVLVKLCKEERNGITYEIYEIHDTNSN